MKAQKAVKKPEEELVKISSSVFVILGLQCNSREEAFFKIACFAKKQRLVENAEALYEELVQRKEKITSVSGCGIALPEASQIKAGLSYAFILCRLKSKIEFTSGKEPICIILVSLGRKEMGLLRLKIMLYLARLLKSSDYRNQFLQAGMKDGVYRLLKRVVLESKKKSVF
ncbi:MAG: PTS sugar transporter subunit IIA [Candidatus Nealsonbacteria bacterium]|nr:PTS sugar transporter subunit IIA [Candidatus Nealsonbacteria bacterium]